MAPESRPWFPFYAADFLNDLRSALLTPAERGYYITLLCHEWIEDGLPDDPEQLAALLKLTPRQFRKVWAKLTTCFAIQAGRLINPRLEAVRHELRDADRAAALERERLAEQGRKGAASRWLKASSKAGAVVGLLARPMTGLMAGPMAGPMTGLMAGPMAGLMLGYLSL
jgi:uncharacterized protein YdaU (DUF1376 family)